MNITQMIWFHDVHGQVEPLKVAIGSRRFTHALLMGAAFDDNPKLDLWRKAADVVRAAVGPNGPVEPIYGRWLWPGYAPLDPLDLFDWRWYGERLRRLRESANRDGVAETALDLEPYGLQPLGIIGKLRDRGYKRDSAGVLAPPLTDFECDNLCGAAKAAGIAVGKADYVLPAPFPTPRCIPQIAHLYRALRILGHNAIAEHTYYDWEYPTWGTNHDDYDVFGAAVLADPTKETTDEGRACYTPASLYAAAQRTRGRVMVYPGNAYDGQTLDTAKAFAALDRPAAAETTTKDTKEHEGP